MNAVPPAAQVPATARERAIVLLVAAVQLVNVLDFMMVMPLGPDFAKALGIDVAHLGVIGGAYTAAAAVTGLIGAMVLDRFDRKWALIVSMLGLAAGTFAGACAVGMRSLIAARLLAGAFGGPATSVALSIVADVVPGHRRGRAMAVVMGAFSVASILGVPTGLKLALWEGGWGWRTPFFGVGALIVVVTLAQVVLMPSMRGHMDRSAPETRLRDVLGRPGVRLALLMMSLVMTGMFAVVPNLSAYLQFNLGYPREHLDLLYMYGGLTTLALMAVAGRLTDRFGALPMSALGTASMVGAILVGIVQGPPLPLPIAAFFMWFMGSTSIRNVAFNALTSRVPPPYERARFQSVLSATQHLSCALGASFSTALLVSHGERSPLEGMPRVGVFAIALSVLAPCLVPVIERLLRANEARPASP